MDVTYSVSETVHRKGGQIVEVDYDYEETRQENVGQGTNEKKVDRTRTYSAKITRQQYETLPQKLKNAFPFDSFLHILKPLMMGTYLSDEIQKAFDLLDRDKSGTIDVNELSAFLPIINPNVTKERLLRYIRKVDENFDHKMNFEEFSSMILRGIGRDIVCGHV
ncbi:unnamed protein product [Didymodactylos carnosus]|uniref:EF-hand domain-containing protein n=1 Tax=Didymodactylos carnosus TaxID=1234261 RepID=A0A815V4Q6_9BILA|nr:unnamed protein product [Didymodactylos carnosus]CAF1525875.1 unnamed protein product [Didymodactylos carnosus]CAF4296450.1 unnamed protein product [Didymodactylos carnosus]CAF4384847.1 unnamed protein product [Didymodactylos carnosus]